MAWPSFAPQLNLAKNLLVDKQLCHLSNWLQNFSLTSRKNSTKNPLTNNNAFDPVVKISHMINTTLGPFWNVFIVNAIVVISHYGRNSRVVFGLFSLLVVVLAPTASPVMSVVGVHFLFSKMPAMAPEDLMKIAEVSILYILVAITLNIFITSQKNKNCLFLYKHGGNHRGRIPLYLFSFAHGRLKRLSGLRSSLALLRHCFNDAPLTRDQFVSFSWAQYF